MSHRDPDRENNPLGAINRAALSPYLLPEGNVQIAFSGGRTSAYMLHQIAMANSGVPDRAKVIFSNTGREMPQTLDFVHEVGVRWSIPIVWLEFRPGEHKHRFEIVSHNSASRDGEPFEALIRHKGFLPNQQTRFCTSELKVRPARDYLLSIGWTNWIAAIGIRADEPSRINREPQRERWQRWYPLADANASKHDIARFWRGQPFDLKLPNVKGNTALGNCDGCFLKSEATLAMLARDFPDRHAWWERMEHLASQIGDNRAGTVFSEKQCRRQLREFIERQGDWIFSLDGALCQATGGDCTS